MDRQREGGKQERRRVMRKPKIAKCPCCDTELHALKHTVRPTCEQQGADDGELLRWVLMWECQLCGCKWLDGQFGKGGE